MLFCLYELIFVKIFQKTVFPVRLMKLLGIKQIILTNVAGAINTQYEVWSQILHTIVTLY